MSTVHIWIGKLAAIFGKLRLEVFPQVSVRERPLAFCNSPLKQLDADLLCLAVVLEDAHDVSRLIHRSCVLLFQNNGLWQEFVKCYAGILLKPNQRRDVAFSLCISLNV